MNTIFQKSFEGFENAIVIDNQSFMPGDSGTIKMNVGRLPSDTRISITAHVIRSKNPGPTALIMGGIHGDEINGIEIVRSLIGSGDIDTLKSGNLILIPLLNVFGFINPENHEGVDLHLQKNGLNLNSHSQMPIRLIANGECLHLGQGKGLHDGKIALFRHRQPDGAEIISAYGHLNEVGNLKVGNVYKVGTHIGKIDSGANTTHHFLHLAIAYGASWETTLRKNPNVPLNVGPTWIRNHYLSPIDHLYKMSELKGNQQSNPVVPSRVMSRSR